MLASAPYGELMLIMLRWYLVVTLTCVFTLMGCGDDGQLAQVLPSTGPGPEGGGNATGPAFGNNGGGGTGQSTGATAGEIEAPDKPQGDTVSQDDELDSACGYGTVYGLICSKAEQKFVNAADVWVDTVDCKEAPYKIEAVSDGQGFYTLEAIPSGIQTIHVKKGDFEYTYNVMVKDGMLTDVTGVGYKECFKAVNECSVGAMWGYVCNEDGTPFGAGADVAIDGVGCKDDAEHHESKTDADGNFFFGNLRSGEWKVTVAADGLWLTYPVTIKDGETVDLKDIGVQLCVENQECGQGSAKGYACFPGDDGYVGGAEVSLTSTDCDGNGFSATTFTDADGKYLFTGVPSGQAHVVLQKGDLVAEYDLLVPADGMANAPDQVPNICFPQQCIPGGITGYVCAPGKDFFIGGAKIEVDSIDCDGNPVHLDTFSDAAGVYVLQNIPAGPQLVKVTKGGFTKQYMVTVIGGQMTQAQDLVDDLCFPPGQDECASGNITGYVCAPNETLAVGGAHVWVQTFDCKGAAVFIDTFTDANGDFVLANVPAGQTKVFLEKGQFKHEYVVTVPPNGTVHAPDVVQDACFPSDSVKFAVVTGNWDHIETILSGLGVDYDLYDGLLFTIAAKSFLTNLPKMMEYDAIFFDCGANHHEILTFNQNLIVNNLQQFVANGGSIYASDWAFVYAEWPWPSAINFVGGDLNNSAPKVGQKGGLGGTVTDAGLVQFLGKSQVSLDYDLGAWVVIQGAPFGTTSHITGNVSGVGQVPLMVSHTPGGAGKVLYTTFHNEAQPTQDMVDILKYMVFNL